MINTITINLILKTLIQSISFRAPQLSSPMLLKFPSLAQFLKLWILLGISFPQLHADPDQGDHARFSHAMQVETRKVDNYPVVFHYGQVRPDFDDSSSNSHRTRINLNGEWSFRFDPQSIGLKNQWYSATHGIADWNKVKVPHCWDAMPGSDYGNWNDQSPNNPPHYNGAAWYRLSFEFNPNKDKRQRIAFLGEMGSGIEMRHLLLAVLYFLR